MSTVHVTPDDLRTAAEAYVQAASDITAAGGGAVPGAEATDSVKLNGYGDHTASSISTQMFEPGEHAKLLLQQALDAHLQAVNALQVNCRALASALHILADVFTSADHEDALRFAFMEPGATAPPGLPSYVDPDESVWQQWDEAQQDADDPDDIDEDNPFRDLLLEQNGNPNESRVGDSYWVDMPPDRGGRYLVTRERIYDGDGNLLSTRYTCHYPDGSTYYYRRDAEGEIIDDFYVPTQPKAQPIGAAGEQERERAEELLEQIEGQVN